MQKDCRDCQHRRLCGRILWPGVNRAPLCVHFARDLTGFWVLAAGIALTAGMIAGSVIATGRLPW